LGGDRNKKTRLDFNEVGDLGTPTPEIRRNWDKANTHWGGLVCLKGCLMRMAKGRRVSCTHKRTLVKDVSRKICLQVGGRASVSVETLGPNEYSAGAAVEVR